MSFPDTFNIFISASYISYSLQALIEKSNNLYLSNKLPGEDNSYNLSLRKEKGSLAQFILL